MRMAFVIAMTDESVCVLVSHRSEIGLGGLEDMMDKADGGATPDFVKGLGIKELDDVFAILGSQTKGAELGQMLLTERFGEVLYRESGFTSTAEMINGRCAVRNF
jgi:hypothetical protein